MSVPGYESYRDSGVAWLGEVPSHWWVEKFRHQFRESSEKIDAEVVGPMLSVSGYRGIEIKEYDDENRRRLDEELVGYRIVRPGQLVVNTMWLNYAGLGVSAHEGHVSPAYRSYWVLPSLEGQYAHHLMRSSIYVQGYTSLLTGIRPNSLQMSRDDLMEFPVIVPPLPEQAAIAAFLDREIGKIDALVEAQRQLIELLREKRQSVISRAVTKGLDPAAPMKESGVEWLGEVPTHWEVKRFSRAIKIAEGQVDPSVEPYVSMVLIAPNHVESGTGRLLSTETAQEQGADSGKYQVAAGDVVYSKIRPSLAKAVLAPCDCICSADMYPLRGRSGVVQTYLKWTLLCRAVVAWAVLESDRVAMPKINREKLNELRLPIPPEAEQHVIAVFLDSQTLAFDDLIKEAEAAIILLQERRAALISAAVTGKIDVRGLTLEQAEAA